MMRCLVPCTYHAPRAKYNTIRSVMQRLHNRIGDFEESGIISSISALRIDAVVAKEKKVEAISCVKGNYDNEDGYAI